MHNDGSGAGPVAAFAEGTCPSLTPRRNLARRVWADGTSGRARRTRKAPERDHRWRIEVSYLSALRVPLVRPACRPFPPPTPA